MLQVLEELGARVASRRPVVVVLAAVLVATLTFAPGTAEAHSVGPSRSRAPGSINGLACGGDLPPCFVLWRESRGNPTAQNRRSSASGKWQAIDSTWAGFGGYRKARHAPPEVQDDFARRLWNGGRGCRHWGRVACR